MENWDKQLRRDNFDEFFKLYSSAAYKSTYKLLGDTTRTENVLVESFIEIYQRRKETPPDRLAFSFGLVLQKKIDPLTEQFPVRESEVGTTRTLDEFTQNSMLMTIHQQIDSLSFQFLELFLFNVGTESGKENSFWGIFRSTGISILSLIQVLAVAIIIYIATNLSLRNSIDATIPIPQSPRSSTISVSDQLDRIYEHLPLPISGHNPASTLDNSVSDANMESPVSDIGTGIVSSQHQPINESQANTTDMNNTTTSVQNPISPENTDTLPQNETAEVN